MKKFYGFYILFFTMMILIITASANAFFANNGKGVFGGDSQTGIQANDPLVKASKTFRDPEEIPEGLTKTNWGKIRASIERDRYRLHKDDRTGAHQAPNYAHDLHATFTREGFEVSPCREEKAWIWGLRLTRYGYGSDLHAVTGPEKMITQDNRIEYHRGDMVEWYINDHRGLEQGFTLKSRPSVKKGSDLLQLQMRSTGNLKPVVEKQGKGIVWRDTHGKEVLRYSGLYAYDANEKELSATMAADQEGIRIIVEDHEAVYPITIDPFIERKKLLASDGSGADYFGISVSISGDTAIVGAYGGDDRGFWSGSAYIFSRHQGGADNWGEVKKLTASDGEANAQFGYSVSISGDTAIVGAYGDDDNGSGSGSAYIFFRDQGGANNWGEVKKITANDGAAEDEFGYSVSISGDTVIVGARYDFNNINRSGSAYIFSRDQGTADNWGEVKKLTAGDGTHNDCFGWTVSISGDTAIVGAPYDDDNVAYSGSAYIFFRDQNGADNWGEVKKITASVGEEYDRFGHSVSISGDTAIVGAFGVDGGSAYIFFRDQNGADNWGEVKKITASDGEAGDLFGWSVSISGDTVMVGAYGGDDNGHDSGSAYIFSRDWGGSNNWGEVKKITASDGAHDDSFGNSVSISGATAIIGAFYDGYNGTASGSAYVFSCDQRGVDNWGEVKKITSSDGAGAGYFGYSVSISGDTVIVGAEGGSGSAYIFSRDQGGADNWGEVKKITASDGASNDHFGVSISISGDTAIVGSYHDDDNVSWSGSAYIFSRDQGGADNWGEVKKIITSHGAYSDMFGRSVSISGDTAIVGARYDSDNGYYFGSAYIFSRDQGGVDNWGEVKKITASDGDIEDFGVSVSISGDMAIVGAPLDDDNGFWSGSAYIFSRDQGGANNWGQVKKLTASDGYYYDEFGNSVSISGDTAIVGAHHNDEFFTYYGSAYIFSRDWGGADNWGEVKKITASDGAAHDDFGCSVSISGATAIIGAFSYNGSAYIFSRDHGGANNWGQVKKLIASDGTAGDAFGHSVSISGDTAIVGDYLDDDNGPYSGSAYVFMDIDICEGDLNSDGRCDMQDWLLFGEDWGRTDCGTPAGSGNPPNDCECDLNKDGRCDMQDWLLFGEDWGRTDCPVNYGCDLDAVNAAPWEGAWTY